MPRRTDWPVTLPTFRRHLARQVLASEVERLVELQGLSDPYPHRPFWNVLAREAPAIGEQVARGIGRHAPNPALALENKSIPQEMRVVIADEILREVEEAPTGYDPEGQTLLLLALDRFALHHALPAGALERLFALFMRHGLRHPSYAEALAGCILHAPEEGNARLHRLLDLGGRSRRLRIQVMGSTAATPEVWRRLLELDREHGRAREPELALLKRSPYDPELIATLEAVDSPEAYQDPVLRSTLLEYGRGENTSILQRSARASEGEEFARIFRALLRRSPLHAEETLRFARPEQYTALTPADLLSLLSSDNPTWRLTAVRASGGLRQGASTAALAG